MKSFATAANLSLVLTLGGLLAAVASGVGHRLQLWDYLTGFKILAAAVIAAAIGAVVALVVTYMSWRGGSSAVYVSVAALAIGLGAVVPPLLWARTARQLPYIHDITTDTENPPAFVAILTERASAPNTAEYGGAEIAQQQRAAYPDIQPVRLDVPPPQAFAASLETARRLGWTIVAADPTAGIVEASDRTLWYGFVDDIVIRVTSDAEGTRVDTRSVSRVGKSDIGMNAKRIREFSDNLRKYIGMNAG
jgi:uncharacterized protein (DUF1499 family)